MSNKPDMYIPTFEDVLAAHKRIKPYIHRTPVFTSSYFNRLTGAELFFKCKNLQKAGVFKARKISNAAFGLSESQAEKGIATHSSGNHGLSLSYAAGRRKIPATVIMPRTAPETKKDAVRGYGAKVVECEPGTSSREEVFARVVASSGADFIHPYNDPRIIAGQATCARELVEQDGPLALVAPIGGGGAGLYYFEGNSGVYNELQCGPYAFMDADYGRNLDKDSKPISETEFARSLFTDELAQSITIGETQHATTSGLIKKSDITPIGTVINGKHQGRTSNEEITLFDGTGVGLQDLAVASTAARLAGEKGMAQKIAL